MNFDIYRLAGPLLQRMPPESAHRLALWALRHGLAPIRTVIDDPILRSTVWGRSFANPVGLAAGFDKNAEAVDALFAQGFGFVEIGSVTPQPQAGNPTPRLFRLPEDGAIINRLGFNSAGLAAVARHLAERAARPAPKPPGILGVNLGKNRDSDNAIADYVAGVRTLGHFADYLVVNVSSPNTPGLRALQGREHLGRLLDAVRATNAAAPPLLVKIAPDLDKADLEDIAEVALAGKADGLIVSNTTLSRPDGMRSRQQTQAGGLSGRPLFALSTQVLGDVYGLTSGKVPLIGVGGIASGRDAYVKIRAGASLVELYSALVYGGPMLVTRIKADLAALLRADGFASVGDAVGADHR